MVRIVHINSALDTIAAGRYYRWTQTICGDFNLMHIRMLLHYLFGIVLLTFYGGQV